MSRTTVNSELDEAEEKIRELLTCVPYPMPGTAVVSTIKALGIDESEVRRAVWNMIDLGRLKLTLDWRLHLPDEHGRAKE